MAKPKHLAILEQGVEVWNKWREENPDVNPDLERAYLVDLDLRGINFSLARLNHADLTWSVLEDANFIGSSLLFADFNDTVLDNADFQKADLGLARIYNSSLRAVDFTNSGFGRTLIIDSNLSDSHGLES